MKFEQIKVQKALSSSEFDHMWVLLRFLIVASLLLILSACGNNAEVENNANLGDEEVDKYVGPAPKTADVQTFKQEFWDKLSSSDRCGACHTTGGQASSYAFVDLADVNVAFTQATTLANDQGEPLVDLGAPASSRVVLRVAEGHNCWVDNAEVCSSLIEGYIANWAGGVDSSSSEGRSIELSAPEKFDAGASKNFPDSAQSNDPNSFEKTIYPILAENCSGCHADTSATPQSPFFASADVDSAYEAAKSKINLDIPDQSRFVSRIQGLHNCWTSDCEADAGEMLQAIQSFSDAIELTQIDPQLITSKAMTLGTAILASGGSRFEDKQIALWEFKSGEGNKAFDTSGIDPAIDLTFSGPVSWVLGYGIDIAAGGKAQASTESSSKLADLITLTGAYSIEAWVIPGNVTQEDARIISYSAGDNARNFAMSQTLYNYEFLNRSSKLIETNVVAGAAGRESLMTNDEDEDLQSSLQHVVMTFDAVNGRRIYVNGVFTDDEDAEELKGGSLKDWNDAYAFVLGNEVSGDHPWSGKIRMVAIHNAVLTDEQIMQNYEVGVGQKYFMLFSIADIIDPLGTQESDSSDTYILFEVEQYDNTAYLFNKPRFISLNSDYTPTTNIPVKGLRIGVNGREAVSGQAFGNIDVVVNAADYTANGQELSRMGTVIAVQKGPDFDEFFLTFERLGEQQNVRVEAEPVAPVAPADPDPVSDIGVKTFDEINATMSAVTGVPVTDPTVAATFESYKQQLPSVENISAFLSSHQMGVAQMAMSYCNVLTQNDKALAADDANRFFKGFDFSRTASVAFDATSKSQIIDPLLIGLMNYDAATPTNNLATQPDASEIKDVLAASTDLDLDAALTDDSYSSLITTMTQCMPDCDTTARTEEIVIAVCAATLGSAITVIQ